MNHFREIYSCLSIEIMNTFLYRVKEYELFFDDNINWSYFVCVTLAHPKRITLLAPEIL